MDKAVPEKKRPSSLRKAAISLVLIAAVVALGAGVARALVKYRPKAQRVAVENPGYTVEVEKIARRDYLHHISGFGTAMPIRAATLSAEVGGVIDWMDASLRVGSPIAKDAPLCRIDDASHSQELTRRRSLLEEARSERERTVEELSGTAERIEIMKEERLLAAEEVQRQEELSAAGAGTEQTLGQARMQLKVAQRVLLEMRNRLQLRRYDLDKIESAIVARKAEVELARLDVERCEIRAPIPGVIAERSVEPGEFVRPGTDLFRIVDLSVVEVPIQVPASEAGAIALDTPVTVMLPQDPSQRWHGVIGRIAPEVDPLNRTTAVYVQVDNRGLDTELRIGQLVEARIEGTRYPGAIVIPRRALIDRYAFVKKGNRAERREPEILRALGDDLILDSGIDEGEELIVTNLEVLYDGARVITSGELNRRLQSVDSASAVTEAP